MKLSIVIPCYNEAAVLNDFYNEIIKIAREIPGNLEMVFVNDGSRDQTLPILKRLAEQDSRVYYLSFSRNFGKEAAMLAGLRYSRGDAVVIMDADLQHPPHLIPEMVEKFQEGYDQVVAKRSRKGEAASRTLLSKLYYKVINRLTDVDFMDGVGDFRLLSKKALKALLTLKEYNRFSKGLFSWIGFKEYVIEYENVTREAGESKWTFKSLLNYGIDGIVSFNNKPLRISIFLGLTITLFSVLYIVTMLFQVLFQGVEVPGYFTTITAILFLGGVQLIFLGIIGEYIGRIYYESKGRPNYIIDEKKMRQVEHVREKSTSRGRISHI
ncbi:glycosyltransferase family 2 protein [Bacillus dakarensis]|uniref:glycosyltransferase family 2 protein n=1 Tax=Robertmurraya dakarensis TaxID=1926278 RepID=UPI000981E95C|nr:glycosyltransferase family 2 protein [Bacillus dakarensis]